MKKRNSKEKVYLIIPFNVYHWYHSYHTIIEDLSECCEVLFSQVLLNEPLQSSSDNSNLNLQQCKTSDDRFFAELEVTNKI